MSNKENVQQRKTSRIPVKWIPSKEGRDPLRSLGLENQQEAGPSGLGLKDIKKEDKDSMTSPPEELNIAHHDIDSKTYIVRDRKGYRESDERHPAAHRRDRDMKYVTSFRGDAAGTQRHLNNTEDEVFQDAAAFFASLEPTPPAAGLVTPPLAEPGQSKSTAKKVKRSLKRPHTKEIQGSPGLKVKKESYERPVCTGYEWPPVYDEEYALDSLNHMMKIERHHRVSTTIGRTSRCCIVNWLVNLNGSAGNPAVVELSCWYMDEYLNKIPVIVERLQLVGAACFWIATKLNGGPGITSARLERWSGFAFTAADLVAMEIRVLSVLHCPRLMPVPHDFVPYLCCWCEDTTGELMASSSFIALCVAVIHKSEYPPSTLASACVRNAIELTGRGDTMLTRLEACPIYNMAASKTRNFRGMCVMTRNAIRTIVSPTFEYRAPYNKLCGPPHHVAATIANAVNSPRLIRDDLRFKTLARTNNFDGYF